MDFSDFCIRPTWNKTSYSICLSKYAELFRYGVIRLLQNLNILLQAKVLPALKMDVARWRLFVVGTPDVAIVAESESAVSFSSVCITSAVLDEYLYTFVSVLVEERTIGPEAKSGKLNDYKLSFSLSLVRKYSRPLDLHTVLSIVVVRPGQISFEYWESFLE